MTDYIAALKRQRAHLKSVNADAGKLAENAEHLRLAGVENPDAEETKEEPKREAAPVDRTSVERQTADAPTAPKRGRPKA